VQITAWEASEFGAEFEVTSAGGFVRPPLLEPKRTDGLWQTTCFELFLKPEDSPAYFEVNCSPSCEWAVYAFDAYREGMRDQPVGRDPEISVSEAGETFWLYVKLDGSLIGPGPSRLGLSAVIEEKDGTKSYWALHHPPGNPDFHHPAGFVLELPVPR
jgi:hypothetical protein